MVGLFSILVFVSISLALGLFIRSRLLVYGETEALIMSFMFGVCVFPLIGIILSVFNLVYIYVVFILAIFIFICDRKDKSFSFASLKFSKFEKIAIICSLCLFIVFSVGGFSSPLLEDGDPNGHAVAASYIAHYHTYVKPADMFVARYMEPYPIGYQLWMGLLSQDTMDIVSTLKTYNYIFISIGILAFFFFVKALTDSEWIAAIGSFILAILPSFSTRFVFAQAFATTQVIVILYLVARSLQRKDNLYIYAGILLGSLFLTHPTTSAIMGGFLVLWVLFDSIINKEINVKFIVFVIVVGCLIGGVWWLHEFDKYGVMNLREQLNLNVLGKNIVGFSDPTMRYYSVIDFVVSPIQNSIDNMTGVGLFAFGLGLLGLVICFKEREQYQILLVIWLAFCIYGIYSNYFPVSLVPSRFWSYMSIPFAAIAAIGMSKIIYHKNELGVIGFVAIVGLFLTSAYPKIVVNTAEWESARFFTKGDIDMVSSVMTNITKGSKAMDACMYERVWSMNLWDDPLDKNAILFKNKEANVSKFGWDSEGWLKLKSENDSGIFANNLTYVHDYLKSKGYEYLLINSRCIKNGVTNFSYENKINEYDSSPLFKVIFNEDLERVYKVI
jgi:hypothetical protein